MKVLILNREGKQANISFSYDHLKNQKGLQEVRVGDTIFSPIEDKSWKIRKIVLDMHYIILHSY